MVRRRNKYKRDKSRRIVGEIKYGDENALEALREEKEEGEVDGDEDQAIEQSTKEWVNKVVKTGMKGDNKKDICKESVVLEANRNAEVNRACNLIHSPKEITLEKHETETRDGGNGETQENKRDIVVYSTNNEEILPLAIQNENGGSVEQHNGSMDKVDVNQIIRTVAVEGVQNIENYRRRLGMQHAVINANGKMWIFIDEAMEYEVVRIEDQMFTIKVTNVGMGIEVLVLVVYTKCTQVERLQLRESMGDMAMTTNIPWVIKGDFNVICNEGEKIGGRAVTEAEVRDFNHCLNDCNLEDQGFKGKVEHLVRSGSDHAPLALYLDTTREEVIKSFRFLNFWVKEESFLEVIQNHWIADFEEHPYPLFISDESSSANPNPENAGTIFLEQLYRGKRGRVETDKPVWMLDTKGSFSVKTTWNYIRHREESNKIYKWIWTKGVPFKMAFLMWRLWKFKIPVDDRVRRWEYRGHLGVGVMNNQNRTWSYFCSFAGINIAGQTLRGTSMKWWDTNGRADMKPYYRALPNFVI
ncbi:hypothetical protein MTR67_003072 [Solanum verrucosum]|uniref:Reverse transcriptase zinc-binding domain-containing protein n=1 Tax=Solanum verrucosum TaxID=315347 RepID=A0AAF0PRT9_SOLVR|nr:hypothetical protein MTR67_003072 [Solanum verrucosum]